MTLVISGITALLVGVLVLFAYRQGIKDGRAIDTGKPVTPLFASVGNDNAAEKTEEEKLLEWAESYEG